MVTVVKKKMFTEYFDEVIEYPSSTRLLHGIQPGIDFNYVSFAYIAGFINHVDIISAVMLQRYMDDEEFQGSVQRIQSEVETPFETHTNVSNGELYDDILILGRTDDMYVYFWEDRDVSDCRIGGISVDKFQNITEVIESWQYFIDYLVQEGDARSYFKIPVKFFKGFITL